MEKYDPQLEARVWQRVYKTEPAVTPEQLKELIAQEWSGSQLCARLAQHYPGSPLGRIAREKQQYVRCLKGLYTIYTGQPPRIPCPPLPRESADRLLRSCCEGSERRAREYDALTPQAPVCARLAEGSRQHYYQLLSLLGQSGD